MLRVFVPMAIWALLLQISFLNAGDEIQAPTFEASAEVNQGSTKAFFICGLSGGMERHQAFAETLATIHTVFTTKLGCTASDIDVLFGDEPQAGDPEVIQTAGRANREELEKRAQLLRDKLRPEDRLWVIVLGHSHYDGRNSWLNLPGPDMHQMEFAKLFADLPVRQQIFVLTAPTSGFYIKPLSAANRIIITATEADWETNETEFAGEFARILSSPPPSTELDVDSDTRITLFDVYITVARRLAQSYRDRELLATEHPLLDDNADGRGTEIQIDFLSVELGGRVKPSKPIVPMISAKSDGNFSKSILMPITQ